MHGNIANAHHNADDELQTITLQPSPPRERQAVKLHIMQHMTPCRAWQGKYAWWSVLRVTTLVICLDCVLLNWFVLSIFAGADRSGKEGRDMETIGLAASSPSCGSRWRRASTAQVGEYGAAFRSFQAAPSCREGAGGQAQPCQSKVAGHSNAGSCLLLCLFCIFDLYLKPLHMKCKDAVLASLGRPFQLQVLFWMGLLPSVHSSSHAVKNHTFYCCLN